MSNQLPTQSDANDGSILIVDDQSENLRSLFEALSCEGYKLRVLGSEQALQVAPLDPPDLILLSIQMSEIDGYEVCRRLKADSKTQRIPVIFLGALAGSIDKEKVFGGGGADYIAQPFQVLEVLARVDHQIRLRRLQQKDAQQRRQLQVRSQLLQDTNEELKLFTSSVSHDLRSPLRGLQGLSQALLEDYGDQLDELGTTYLQRISATATNMNQLLDDLIAYSRVDRISISLEPVSLEAVVNTAIRALQAEIDEKQAVIKVQPNLPEVIGYSPVLDQVANNLLDNALKYIALGDRPAILIGADLVAPESADSEPAKPAQVCWFFQDDGIGIAPADQAKIFQPFSRLHGSEAYLGSGFGLAIVQRGIARLGGTCGVESVAQQGSRFWVKLPAHL